MAAAFVANLIRYTQESYRPERDLVLALTATRRSFRRTRTASSWLLKHHRDLIDAEFALNEGGGGQLDKSGSRVASASRRARRCSRASGSK